MDVDTYCTIRDVAKLISRVGFLVTLLGISTYLAVQSLSNVSAGTPDTNINSWLEPTPEDRTRSILQRDLNEAWDHYRSGDFSDDMWEGVHTHVTRQWNEQAHPKGWGALGWKAPKTGEPDAAASSKDLPRVR